VADTADDKATAGEVITAPRVAREFMDDSDNGEASRWRYWSDGRPEVWGHDRWVPSTPADWKTPEGLIADAAKHPGAFPGFREVVPGTNTPVAPAPGTPATAGERGEVELYRHYKGGLYEKLHDATHSETQEPVVVYRSVETGRVWVRPAAMWSETVGGVQRFAPAPGTPATAGERGEATHAAEISKEAYWLYNLLAVIHRDGGHRMVDVGVEQAVREAMEIVPDLRAKLRAAEDELDRMRPVVKAADAWHTTSSLGGLGIKRTEGVLWQAVCDYVVAARDAALSAAKDINQQENP
jgi:hypothetical protein